MKSTRFFQKTCALRGGIGVRANRPLSAPGVTEALFDSATGGRHVGHAADGVDHALRSAPICRQVHQSRRGRRAPELSFGSPAARQTPIASRTQAQAFPRPMERCVFRRESGVSTIGRRGYSAASERSLRRLRTTSESSGSGHPDERLPVPDPSDRGQRQRLDPEHRRSRVGW